MLLQSGLGITCARDYTEAEKYASTTFCNSNRTCLFAETRTPTVLTMLLCYTTVLSFSGMLDIQLSVSRDRFTASELLVDELQRVDLKSHRCLLLKSTQKQESSREIFSLSG